MGVALSDGLAPTPIVASTTLAADCEVPIALAAEHYRNHTAFQTT
jgi:hypothetical protein